MLVLSRKPHERVFVTKGNVRIEVSLVRINLNGARIGIEAPKDWEIVREELLKPRPNLKSVK